MTGDIDPHNTPPKSTGCPAAMRVLIVDDNPDAAQMLALFLEVAGYDTLIEFDGKGALEQAAAHMPRVCLLDISLPDMNGYALAQALRALPGGAQAILIALTGYGRTEDMDKAKAAGFDHHFVKPADPEELAALLAQISASPRQEHGRV